MPRPSSARILIALLSSGTALIAPVSVVKAAGIERAVPGTARILHEEGRYGEFSLTYTDPEQSGDGGGVPAALGGPFAIPGSTGDLFDSHWNATLAYKGDLGDRASFAIIYDQPYGADTDYSDGFYAGTAADLDAHQFTGVLAYDVTQQIKIYGGVRAQRIDADAAIPFVGPSAGLPGYTITTDNDWGYGWLAGVAYSRPEIALRVALTYYSDIEHDFETVEFGGIPIPGVQDGATETGLRTPQSVNLDFQTGVAADTLVFGSVRWVDWSEFAIEPPSYVVATSRPLVDYADDWTTYTLGVGRKFTDTLGGALSVSYEPSIDEELTTLGPYDGRTSATAALSYELAQATITTGVTYGRLGDATNLLQTDFNDGSVLGIGVRVGYRF